ncbi:hypothetical protein ACI8AC_23950 [Geodermatophilus sp. SYSU D00758]
MLGSLARGLAAGAAGTTVLTAVTHLDVLLRGRPSSDLPGRVVEAAAAAAGQDLPGQGEREERRDALGALAGTATGLGVGVLASAARSAGVRLPAPLGAAAAGAAAMAASDVPAALLGVSDPRTWSREDWLADVVPHLAYGATVQTVLAAAPTRRERRRPLTRAGAGLTARAGLLGVAAGMRSSLGVAGPVLTTPGRGLLTRAGALAAVAGEVVADKQPETPDRTVPPSAAARLLAGGVGATRLAARERANGALPLVAGVAGAAAGTWGGVAWRRAAGRWLDPRAAALVEDGVALLLAAAACRAGRRPLVAPLVPLPRP